MHLENVVLNHHLSGTCILRNRKPFSQLGLSTDAQRARVRCEGQLCKDWSTPTFQTFRFSISYLSHWQHQLHNFQGQVQNGMQAPLSKNYLKFRGSDSRAWNQMQVCVTQSWGWSCPQSTHEEELKSVNEAFYWHIYCSPAHWSYTLELNHQVSS